MVSFHNVPVFSCLIIKRIYSIFRFKLGTDYAENHEAIKKSVLFCIISVKSNKSPEL